MTTKRLPVLFLDDAVLLPGMIVPIELDESARAAVDAAAAGSEQELLVAPRLDDRYASYGVVATVEKVGRSRGGEPAAVLRTGERARIGTGVTGPGAALWVEAEPVGAPAVTERDVELAADYKKLVVAVLQKREAWQIIDTVNAIDDPSTLADTAGWAPYLLTDRKRQLLETPEVEQRLTLLIEWTRDYLAEVDKLERSSEQSPETGWIRTWLDTVLELPWNVTTEDSTDIAAARTVLDEDHHGLDEVKERIVVYLAVRARRASRGLSVIGGRGSGAVVLLAGPPGVGKTSLGESVARALGRKFVRVALGGVRDEAEIRGHRRTYVGAQSGRIVRAIKEAGSMNPVVLLDEVDKVGSDFRGDPAAALLEVLDPAQNH